MCKEVLLNSHLYCLFFFFFFPVSYTFYFLFHLAVVFVVYVPSQFILVGFAPLHIRLQQETPGVVFQCTIKRSVMANVVLSEVGNILNHGCIKFHVHMGILFSFQKRSEGQKVGT